MPLKPELVAFHGMQQLSGTAAGANVHPLTFKCCLVPYDSEVLGAFMLHQQAGAPAVHSRPYVSSSRCMDPPVFRMLVQDLQRLRNGQQVQHAGLGIATPGSFLSRPQHSQIRRTCPEAQPCSVSGWVPGDTCQ